MMMNTLEYQINDRLLCMRFLGLELKDKAPDAKAIWLFKEKLIKAKVSEKLFDTFFLRSPSSILRTERF